MALRVPLASFLVPFLQRLAEVVRVVQRIEVPDTIQIEGACDKVKHHLCVSSFLEKMARNQVSCLSRPHPMSSIVCESLPHEYLSCSRQKAEENRLEILHAWFSLVDRWRKVGIEYL